MKLKRYALLKNKKIYDLQNKKDVKKFDMVKNGNQEAYGVKKTSDNILDLLEDDDLVLSSLGYYDINNVFTVSWIKTSKDEDNFKVEAIFKRQPNGDYKRYEVEK